MPDPTWTEERTETLRTLRSDGHSAREISRALGITRNAVMGKIHRLGLSAADPRFRQPAPAKARIPKPRKRKEKPVKAVSPPPGGIPFLDGSDRYCRFPLWDDNTPLDDKMICGAPPEPDTKYCATHKARMFQKRERAA